MIENIMTAFQSVPAEAWGLIGGAIGASALQMKVKGWLNLESDRVIQFITVVFSLAAAVIPAVLGWLSANPESLGVHTATFFMAMTLAYRYVVKPGSAKLVQVKEDRAAFTQYKANLAAAAAPAADLTAGIPTETLPSIGSPTVTKPAQNTNIPPTFEG